MRSKGAPASCHLKLQNHLSGDFQLGVDIAHEAITPAFQEVR
jgi:hypothetical protein